ncbi:MAG: hypothetical protein ACP5UD_05610 [Conexivisphaera sp.]
MYLGRDPPSSADVTASGFAMSSLNALHVRTDFTVPVLDSTRRTLYLLQNLASGSGARALPTPVALTSIPPGATFLARERATVYT